MNAARSRSIALEKLIELRSITLEHILKISTMPNHPAANHWQKEINSYQTRLRRYNKSKSSKPNYSKNILWEYLWTDQIDELPMAFVEEYEVTKLQLDINDVKARLTSFIDGICES